ncbi:MAG: PD-(D/E)XK nuclease family protein [Dehalococcoidia bacterium]
MSSNENAFDTAVRSVSGVYPAAPVVWSYSSLTEAQACPRRWMLTHASYPSIWARPGYPHRPSVPELAGRIVHRCIEVVLRELRSQGCTAVSDPKAVSVLRTLGGYSRLAQHTTDEVLEEFANNPRAEPMLTTIRLDLQRRLPDIRQQVQTLVARTSMAESLAQPPTVPAPQFHVPTPLRLGAYTEVTLDVPELHLVGRVDFIFVSASHCEITDYKSGAPQAEHDEQLRLYALLWSRDRVRNPKSIPVEKLTVAYPGYDRTVEPPSDGELQALAEQILGRIELATSDLQGRPPTAKPTEANCTYCTVRHLCDEYWQSHLVRTAWQAPRVDYFADVELKIGERNGTRSWIAELAMDGSLVLLRTLDEAIHFSSGDSIRLLNVVINDDDATNTKTITLSRSSEAFQLR